MQWGNNYIAATETPEGLLFTASNAGREELSNAYRNGGYPAAESAVCENTGGNGLSFVPPEFLGLTEMPAFSFGFNWPDEGESAWDGAGLPVYGFPDYMIADPWQALKNRGRVLFPIVATS